MTLGEALSAAREELGLSVEDVSRDTKIRGQLIRDIETDDYSHCGGHVYARGHIRAIAGCLHLEPASLLAEFDRVNGTLDAPAAREVFEHEVLAMPQRTGPNWTAAMAVAAVVLLLVAVVSLVNPNTGGTPVANDSVPTTQPSATTTTPPSTAPTTVTAPDDTVALVNPGGVFVRVRIKPGGKSWVQAVDSNGAYLFRGVLTNGAVKDFRAAREIRLVLGNAGDVLLVVNGRDLGSPGGSGQVVRTVFTPGDPANAG